MALVVSCSEVMSKVTFCDVEFMYFAASCIVLAFCCESNYSNYYRFTSPVFSTHALDAAFSSSTFYPLQFCTLSSHAYHFRNEMEQFHVL